MLVVFPHPWSSSRIEESQALKGNGYPTRFICRSESVSSRQKSNVDCEVSPKTVNIPYIQGLSESIKRVLSELDIVVCFYHMQTLHHLVKPKDPLPPNLINLQSTLQTVYVGQTGRSLECRLKEHKRAVKCGSVDASANAEHVWNEGHQVDCEAAGVLNC